MKHLRKVLTELAPAAGCSGCGRCISSCPSWKASGNEAQNPRGRVALVLALAQRRLQPEEMAHSFATCLQCGLCQQACPANVPLMWIFRAARLDLHKHFTLSRQMSMLEHALAANAIVPDLLQPLLYFAQRASGLKWLRILPNLPQTAFALRNKQLEKTRRKRALLFAGCLARRVFTGVADAAVKCLAAYGFEVVMPSELVCCARPQMLAGADIHRAVARNLRILAAHRNDYLVTPCPGCLDMIKNVWPHLDALTSEEKKLADALAAAALDMGEFLASAGKMPPMRRVDMHVFWHKPCLLTQTAANAAEGLLRQAVALTGKSSGDCCGASLLCLPEAGKKPLKTGKKDMGRVLAGIILREAKDSGAEVVATGCPGCMLALGRQNKMAYFGLELRHSLENYAGSLK